MKKARHRIFLVSWSRFTVRALLAIISIIAINSAFLHYVLQEYSREQDALQQLMRARAPVRSQSRRPPWIPGIVDEKYAKYFDRITALDLSGEVVDEETGYWRFSKNITDEHVHLVLAFKKLERLSIASTRVTSKSLGELVQLRDLKALNISGVRIDDDAIQDFRRENPSCAICRRWQIVEATLRADGSVVVEQTECPLSDAAPLLRQAAFGPMAFGHGNSLLLWVSHDPDIRGPKQDAMTQQLKEIARQAGYRSVQVSQ